MIQPLVMATLSPFAGRISDRVEARPAASFGPAISVAGLSMLVFRRCRDPLGFVAVCLVVLGTGFALFSSPNTNAVTGSVGRRDMGVALATLGTMRLVGQMMSMALTLVVMAARLHGQKVTPEVFPRFMLQPARDFRHLRCAVRRGRVRIVGAGEPIEEILNTGPRGALIPAAATYPLSPVNSD